MQSRNIIPVVCVLISNSLHLDMHAVKSDDIMCDDGQEFDGATRAGVYLHLSSLTLLTALSILGPIHTFNLNDPLMEEEVQRDEADALAEIKSEQAAQNDCAEPGSGSASGSGSGSALTPNRPIYRQYTAGLSEPHLHFLSHLVALRVLAITCIPSGTGACLMHLRPLTRLEALLLDGRIVLGPPGYAALRGLSLPSLLSLQLPAASFDPDDDLAGPERRSGIDAFLSALPSAFPSLVNLEVGNCTRSLSKASFKSLMAGSLPRLRYLTMQGQRSLSSKECIDIVDEVGPSRCRLKYLHSWTGSLHLDKTGLRVPSAIERPHRGIMSWPSLWEDSVGDCWTAGSSSSSGTEDVAAATSPLLLAEGPSDGAGSSALPGDFWLQGPDLPNVSTPPLRKCAPYTGFAFSLLGGLVLKHYEF